MKKKKSCRCLETRFSFKEFTRADVTAVGHSLVEDNILAGPIHQQQQRWRGIDNLPNQGTDIGLDSPPVPGNPGSWRHRKNRCRYW